MIEFDTVKAPDSVLPKSDIQLLQEQINTLKSENKALQDRLDNVIMTLSKVERMFTGIRRAFLGASDVIQKG